MLRSTRPLLALLPGLLLLAFLATTHAFLLPVPVSSPSALTVRRATASSTPAQPRPPLPDNFYAESLLDKVALALFRRLVQQQINFVSTKPGYDGLIEEARHYQLQPGVTAEDQQRMVKSCLTTIAGPLVPPVYRTFMAPWFWAPFLTAIFTPVFFKFLVGPNKYDVRDDGAPGGVYAERCRFLEETNCKGLCLHMCKLPTQQFFKETLGLDMTMTPDYETYECRLSFGMVPKPVEEDESIPKGCLQGCGAVAALQQQKLDRVTVCDGK